MGFSAGDIQGAGHSPLQSPQSTNQSAMQLVQTLDQLGHQLKKTFGDGVFHKIREAALQLQHMSSPNPGQMQTCVNSCAELLEALFGEELLMKKVLKKSQVPQSSPAQMKSFLAHFQTRSVAANDLIAMLSSEGDALQEIQDLLEGGLQSIEDVILLMSLLAALMQGGGNITLQLLQDVKDAIQEFIDQAASQAGDPMAFLMLLAAVEQFVGSDMFQQLDTESMSNKLNEMMGESTSSSDAHAMEAMAMGLGIQAQFAPISKPDEVSESLEESETYEGNQIAAGAMAASSQLLASKKEEGVQSVQSDLATKPVFSDQKVVAVDKKDAIQHTAERLVHLVMDELIPQQKELFISDMLSLLQEVLQKGLDEGVTDALDKLDDITFRDV